jgi:hypothetical protein
MGNARFRDDHDRLVHLAARDATLLHATTIASAFGFGLGHG